MFGIQRTAVTTSARGARPALGTPWRRTALATLGFAGLCAAGAAPVQATTLAYWRFEGDGVTTPQNGDFITPTAQRTAVEADPDPVNPPAFISGFDSSGNGNHLYTWDDNPTGHVYRPNFLNKGAVQNGGAANNWQIQNFGGSPASFTWSAQSAPTGTDLELATPAQWTVEATVKPTTVNGAYRTIVGRDGNGVLASDPNLAPFYLQLTNENQFRVNYTDVGGVNHILTAPAPVIVNQTYHLAATSNGSTLSLYLDQANGLGYQLAASMNLTGSSNTALARDTVGSTTPGDPTFGWSVGRGRYGQGDLQGDNHVDRWLGFIDEVRISDVALAPNQLLFAGQNAPAGPSLLINRDTGVISLTNLRSSLQVRQYQIDSPNGALNIAQHTPIGGRLDSQGNSSFDSDGVWFSQTAISATQIIEEDVASPDGGALGVGGTQTIVLSGTDGWIANPTESVTASVQVYDPVLGNVTFGVPVLFTGNGGVAFRRGDLNTDGAITGLDWAAFRTNAHSAAAVGLTDAQSYSLGDLDGDQDVDYADFRAFQGLYDAANGVGALDAVIAAVPEPSAALLALAACGSLAAVRRRAQA